MSKRTAGFDIVAAITEDTINFQFEQLFAQGGMPTTLKLDLSDTGISIDARLAPPEVSLLVPDTTATVLFLLHLSSGSFSYYEGFGPKAKPNTVPIKNWVYAFRVNMNFAALAADALKKGNLSEVVRRSLSAFDSKMFTIKQLLLDFENCDIADFDPTHTSMPLPDGKPASPNTITQWQTGLSNYFKSLKGTGNPYVLGYAVQSNDADADPGTPALLNPTGGTFSTFQDGRTEGMSTLNFLLKTDRVSDDKLPPVPPNGVFDKPLVTDTAYDGAMVIDSDVFRAGYLEQVLLPGIAEAAGVPTLAPATDHNADYRVWSSSMDSTDNGRVVADAGLLNIYQDFSNHRDCTVAVSPGSIITVDGTLRVGYVWYDKPFNGYVEAGHVTVTREWHAVLELSAGPDGRLTLVLNSFDSGQVQTERSENILEQLLDLVGAGVDRAESEFADALSQMQGTIAGNISRGISETLAALGGRIVLPGGQVFFFSNAVLDEELNLVCAVQYKTERPKMTANLAAGKVTGTEVLTLTSSSELMTNHEAGRALDPQRRFRVFQDSTGEPAMLSIGTDDTFRLIHRDSSSATGWSERVLGANLVAGLKPVAFEVSQDTSGHLRLALALGSGTASQLYLTGTLSNDLSGADWVGVDRSWVARPATDDVGVVTSIIMGTSDDDAGAPLTIVATEQHGQAYHWIVNADVTSTAWVWQRYVLPENATSLVDLAIGAMYSKRGVYALYDMAGGARRLEFTSLPDPRYHKTANYVFDLPSTVERIEAMDNPAGSSDLYVAGDGIYMYPQSHRIATTIAAKGTIPPATALLGRSDGVTVSLFTVAGDDQLWYTKGDAVRPDAAWSAPLLIGRGCAQIAALRSRVWLNNHVLVTQADGILGYLWQDPVTSLWGQASVPLPDTGTVLSYPSYTTQVILARPDGTPAAGATVSVTTSTVGTVVLNGEHHRVGPDFVATVNADGLGSVTVISRTSSLTTARLTFSAAGLAPVTVQPAQEILDQLATVRTGDDLTGATLRSGPRAGQPLLAAPPDAATLNSTAYAIGQLSALPDATTDQTFGIRLDGENSAILLRADAEKVLDSVTEAVTGNPGDVLRHLGETADAIESLVVRANGIVTEILVEVGRAIYRFVINAVEHVLEAINWLLENLLGLSLDDLINWLGFGFDWDDIKQTHRIMRQMVNWTLEYATGEANEMAGQVEAWFDDLKSQVRTPIASSVSSLTGVRSRAQQQQTGLSGTTSKMASALKGRPSGNWAQYHLTTGGGATQVVDIVAKAGGPIAAFVNDVLTPVLSSLEESCLTIGRDLQRAWSDNLTPAQMLETIGTDVVIGILDALQKVFAGLLRLIGDIIDELRAGLNYTLDIPVLSLIYRAEIGGDLSLLDLGCLLAAIPATIIYRLATNRSASGDLTTAGLADPKQTYQQVFGRLAGGGPLPVKKNIVTARAFADPEPGSKLDEALKLYSWVGIPVGMVAEAIQSAYGILQAQASAGTSGTGGTSTKPTECSTPSVLDWGMFFVDMLGTAMTYPVGDDFEATVQRTAWKIHLCGEVAMMAAKLFGGMGKVPIIFKKGIAGADMAINTALWYLNLAGFVMEMDSMKTSAKARDDEGQNILKLFDNLFQWLSKGFIDITELDEEPESKELFALTATTCLAGCLATGVARIYEGIKDGRDLQAY
jgi:hypothetical protein